MSLDLIHPKLTWDVRNCYIPRPGYKLVTIDYNNLELLATAHQLKRIYGHSRMCDIINQGDKPVDLHSMFASLLMSKETHKIVTYDDFKSQKHLPEFKAYRSKGKPMSLGRPGGMGMDTIRIQCEKEGIKLGYKVLFTSTNERLLKQKFFKFCKGKDNLRLKRTSKTEWSIVFDEVVGLRNSLDELYPDLKAFLTEGHKRFIMKDEFKWKKNEFDEWEKDPYYKFDVMGIRRAYCTYTEFCNGFLMQSPSAAMAKTAGYHLWRHFADNDDVNMLFFIHDEYGFEIRDNHDMMANVHKACEIMVDASREVLSSVGCAVEYSINDYWSKSNNQLEGVCYKKIQHDKLQLL